MTEKHYKILTNPIDERYGKVVEVMEFTDKTKDRVYNFVRCPTAPDWEDGEPVLKIQTREGIMTARNYL